MLCDHPGLSVLQIIIIIHCFLEFFEQLNVNTMRLDFYPKLYTYTTMTALIRKKLFLWLLLPFLLLLPKQQQQQGFYYVFKKWQHKFPMRINSLEREAWRFISGAHKLNWNSLVGYNLMAKITFCSPSDQVAKGMGEGRFHLCEIDTLTVARSHYFLFFFFPNLLFHFFLSQASGRKRRRVKMNSWKMMMVW